MLGNLITLVIFIALVVLFAWLTRRAWRERCAGSGTVAAC